MEILLVAAVLPAAVLMFYVYKKDSVEKEPFRLVARLFVFGVVSGPLAAIAENVAFACFESTAIQGAALIVLEYFVGVALVEEGFKFLFLSTIRKNREFNYVFDGIVYAVAVSLGFATLENILYVFDGGIEVASMRAIFSVPGHCAGGVVMGCFFGLARQKEVAGNKSSAALLYFMAILLPTIEHGFYDAALSMENDALATIALGVELAFILLAGVLVNRVSKNDAAIYPETRRMLPFAQVAQPTAYVQPPYSQPPYQQPPYGQQPYQQQPIDAQQPYGQQPPTAQPPLGR